MNASVTAESVSSSGGIESVKYGCSAASATPYSFCCAADVKNTGKSRLETRNDRLPAISVEPQDIAAVTSSSPPAP